uniref:DM5 domain-containing protein n=1 Tax=Rhabditophanes sp. KR3021 TaxID=114890 RepID=A0AC35TJQ3_9BILA
MLFSTQMNLLYSILSICLLTINIASNPLPSPVMSKEMLSLFEDYGSPVILYSPDLDKPKQEYIVRNNYVPVSESPKDYDDIMSKYYAEQEQAKEEEMIFGTNKKRIEREEFRKAVEAIERDSVFFKPSTIPKLPPIPPTTTTPESPSGSPTTATTQSPSGLPTIATTESPSGLPTIATTQSPKMTF